jgi:hypothetical protein
VADQLPPPHADTLLNEQLSAAGAGVTSSETPPGSRTLADADGHTWHVYVVVEGLGWDADLPDRRSNWLACVSLADRRFIAPVPEGWESWSEDELRAAVAKAPRDKRRHS